jgi:hypothetical protein
MLPLSQDAARATACVVNSDEAAERFHNQSGQLRALSPVSVIVGVVLVPFPAPSRGFGFATARRRAGRRMVVLAYPFRDDRDPAEMSPGRRNGLRLGSGEAFSDPVDNPDWWCSA